MIEIPSVIHKDKNGNERAVSLATRLLTDRIVMVTGEVTDELAEAVVQQLLYLESVDPDKPVNMIVSGPGGSVTAGFSITSTMNIIKCPVHTTIMGQVASMSSVIAMSGEKGCRKIYPNSRVMLHSVSSGTKGTIHDMKIAYEETQRINEIVFNHMAKCCNKKLDQMKKDCDRDLWMSEDDAIKYGCCDLIVQKR